MLKTTQTKKGVGHSKPILTADEQPLAFPYLNDEHDRAGVCGEKNPGQRLFRCPDNYTEFA